MSIECLNKALKIQFENQTPTKRLILILLANYCDDQNSCYPSYSHIAKLAGLKDPKHIARIVKEFEELGLLKIQTRYKADGGNTSNRYFLTLTSTDNPPMGLQTPIPPILDTMRVGVSKPPNTKEETKDNTKDNMYDFKSFWEAYPRKENKHQAEVKYKVAIKTIQQDNLLEMLNRFNNDIQAKGMDKKFIPHCTTWLTQKRYLDYDSYKMQEIAKVTPKSDSSNWYDDLQMGSSSNELK